MCICWVALVLATTIPPPILNVHGHNMMRSDPIQGSSYSGSGSKVVFFKCGVAVFYIDEAVSSVQLVAGRRRVVQNGLFT